MRWPKREVERLRIARILEEHSAKKQRLPGIQDPAARETLATQIVASLRREDYYRLVQTKRISAARADPNNDAFDAERAVTYHVQRDDVDEAAWLIFLMTHFARPADTGWLRLRDVYGRLGTGIWDWRTVSADPAIFAEWLAAHWREVGGKFGNHRKYESLRPDAARNMGRVVSDYICWIGGRGHATFFADAVARGGNDPFDLLYREMAVTSFGRLAKFDYLMLLSRYGLVAIAPHSAYLHGATGPRSGASLLFTGEAESASSANNLQRMLDALDADLGVGMAVLEDALCNWQKQPMRFIHYTG